MKISHEILHDFSISYPLEQTAPLQDILLLDIETTGFSANSSCLYLIGCAYFQEAEWHLIQWFSEDYKEETSILSAFFDFAMYYKYLIHFNGNQFDLPFLVKKCQQLGLAFCFDTFQQIDLYKKISPYKTFLKLPNCKQKTLENCLGIYRKDLFSGGELIALYHTYVKTKEKSTEQIILLHNLEDVKGMLEILPLLALDDIFHKPNKVRKVQANYDTDLNGNLRRELFITLSLNTKLPTPVSSQTNTCYFRGENKEAVLKIPIYEGELKYFYSNYKDYYYLPAQDIAIHKSAAFSIDKKDRRQATASNCYTKKASAYLPQWKNLFQPCFKKDYKSKELFFELTDERKKDRDFFTEYVSHILSIISVT